MSLSYIKSTLQLLLTFPTSFFPISCGIFQLKTFQFIFFHLIFPSTRIHEFLPDEVQDGDVRGRGRPGLGLGRGRGRPRTTIFENFGTRTARTRTRTGTRTSEDGDFWEFFGRGRPGRGPGRGRGRPRTSIFENFRDVRGRGRRGRRRPEEAWMWLLNDC